MSETLVAATSPAQAMAYHRAVLKGHSPRSLASLVPLLRPVAQNKNEVVTDDILNRLGREYAVSLNRTGSHKQTYRTIAERKKGVEAYFNGGSIEAVIDGEKETFALDGWLESLEQECDDKGLKRAAAPARSVCRNAMSVHARAASSLSAPSPQVQGRPAPHRQL